MQTPPKSTAEPQPVECPKLEHPSLKRGRSVVFSDPPERTPSITDEIIDTIAGELAHAFTENLVSAFSTKRTSPRVLCEVIDELKAMPHVPIKAPKTARECDIRNMILLDNFLEATKKAHAKVKLAWNRTPWERQRGANFCVLDGETEDHEGKVIPDGCAICGVVKTECMKPDEHFGPRGESPPDSVCSYCSENFYNRYNSAHKLELHVAEKHADKA